MGVRRSAGRLRPGRAGVPAGCGPGTVHGLRLWGAGPGPPRCPGGSAFGRTAAIRGRCRWSRRCARVGPGGSVRPEPSGSAGATSASDGPVRRRSVRGSGARRTVGGPRSDSRRRARASRGPGCRGSRAARRGSSRPGVSAGPDRAGSGARCTPRAASAVCRRSGWWSRPRGARARAPAAPGPGPMTAPPGRRPGPEPMRSSRWRPVHRSGRRSAERCVRRARAERPGGRPPAPAGSGRRRSATQPPARARRRW